MPELHIKEIAQAVNGTVINAVNDRTFTHFHFDTRLITEANTLFFAFKTDSGDGHRFVRQMEEKEGAGAVVSREFDSPGLTFPLIRVEDPLKAAQQLARYVRQQYRHVKYVGITGSVGKTTTKEFIYQLLSHKLRAYRSFKNWNNWIGMPFSILNMKGDEEAAVFELAMSYPGIGEIDLLAEILRPDTAVILNVFPVHMEFLKTVDNAAIAKCEILNYLDAGDTAFINADSGPVMKRLDSGLCPGGHKVFFGKENGNPRTQIRLKEVIREKSRTRMIIDYYGLEAEFVTSFINLIHIENLFIAILVARHLGMKNVEIREALDAITPLPGRGEIYNHKGFTIVDETYNSNPEALKRTLEWVNREYKGTKTAILGDMLELGEEEDRFHKEVGQFYAGLDFHRLITVGQRAQKIAEGALEGGTEAKMVRQFDNAADAGKYLKEVAEEKSVLVFKASRGIRLEEAIREFTHE
jgi:UDP-N-acetylmuramoyl-tripeptide--D-alanyl-D-alanine ligase